MNHLTQFLDYANDFEETYVDDDWQRVAKHLHGDIIYEVHNAPVACSIKGKTQVCDGIRKALDGFDRRCERSLQKPDVVTNELNRVLIHGSVAYKRQGELFTIRLWQIASFHENKISHLMDIYDPGIGDEYIRWIERWGDLDGSYL